MQKGRLTLAFMLVVWTIVFSLLACDALRKLQGEMQLFEIQVKSLEDIIHGNP